jgi:hypothetical protein
VKFTDTILIDSGGSTCAEMLSNAQFWTSRLDVQIWVATYSDFGTNEVDDACRAATGSADPDAVGWSTAALMVTLSVVTHRRA